jgi:tetratricopeptide (TPR) repeat protein
MLRAAAEVEPQVRDPTNGTKALAGFRSILYNWAGRFDEAIMEAERGRGAATSLEEMADLQLREALARGGKGDYQQALTVLTGVLATAERTGNAHLIGRALNFSGWLFGELQNHQEALEWNTRGLTFALDSDFLNPEVENNARLNLGDALVGLGRLDDAEEQFQVVEQMVRHPRPQDHWMLWRYAQRLFHSYGELWLSRGDAGMALAYADDCLQGAEQTGSRKNIVKGRRLRGQALLAQGKLEEAEPELARALELAQEVGNPPQLWKTRLALGDLYTAQGRAEEARAAYRAAREVIEGVAVGLPDPSLRETFLTSAHVRHVRQLVGDE